MSTGRPIVEEQTSPHADHDQQEGQDDASEAERSPAEQAKERERQMEQSGEENSV
jgi:hypothetical protein